MALSHVPGVQKNKCLVLNKNTCKLPMYAEINLMTTSPNDYSVQSIFGSEQLAHTKVGVGVTFSLLGLSILDS